MEPLCQIGYSQLEPPHDQFLQLRIDLKMVVIDGLHMKSSKQSHKCFHRIIIIGHASFKILIYKGRFTQSNFFIQLFFSPLFKTTIGCVNTNFWQDSDIFYVLDENRTCSISIQLDQKSRQFFIFPRSIL